MIDTDPEDGDLAQARHRIRVLEREHRELQQTLEATKKARDLALEKRLQAELAEAAAVKRAGAAEQQQRALAKLSSTGLLWWINRVAFHPLGFALALNCEDDGRITGWRLLGFGREPFAFSEQTDDECFTKAMATFEDARAFASTPFASAESNPEMLREDSRASAEKGGPA